MQTQDLARWRLVAQRLVGRSAPDAVTAVSWMTCMQGQDLPGSTRSVALRSTSRTLEEVRAAYDGGQIVRCWPMRGTLHVVAARDAQWMTTLTSERVLAGMARRREQLEISATHLDRAAEVAQRVLADGGQRRADLLAAFFAAGIPSHGGPGYHVLVSLTLRGVIIMGPLQGKEQLWVLAKSWLPATAERERQQAIADWALRYFRSHGPATWADFRWWTKLLARDVAPIQELVASQLESVVVEGVSYLLDPETPLLARNLATELDAPLLLPGFDELILGYADRSATLSRANEQLVVPGKNGVFKPTLVVGGQAVATWKQATAGDQGPVITPFDEGTFTRPTTLPELPL